MDADFVTDDECAACGETEDLRAGEKWGDIAFCHDCVEVTWPDDPNEYYDDLGVAG